MDTIFQRYRNLTILAAVLFGQMLILAIQVKRPTEAGPVRLVRFWAVAAITPLEKGIVHTEQGISNVWRNYIWLRGLHSENEALRNENERLRLEQIRLAQDAAQARRLQALLQFKEQTVSQTVAAQVIGASGSETSRILYIDKGYDDGVRTDMAVITSEGVVGKVLRVYNEPTTRHTAQVLLLTDPTSGVGGILEKTRLQGILKGTPSGELILSYIMSDEKVAVGERVLTSGGDRVFPKGMQLGIVTQVSPGPELFLNIRVKPAAQLSKLEEVLVITKIEDETPAVAADQSGPVRAADILAQRLPTVVVKPPDAESSKKETTEPLSMAEWIRRQKLAQQQKGTPGGAPPAAGTNVAKPAVPPSATTSGAPKTGTAAPKQPSATGQSTSVPPTSTSTTAAPKKLPSTTPANTTTAPSGTAPAAPKKAAPKKQPDATAPSSPSGQPPVTPPGVTL